MLAGHKWFKMAGKTSSIPTQKKRRHQHQQKTHISNLILMLFLVIIIIDKMNLENDTKSKPKYSTGMETRQNLLQLNTLHIALKLKLPKQDKLKKISVHQITVLTLLILLANDVHPNPGPPPLNPQENSDNQCIMCSKLAKNEDALKCDTCNKWSHITCTGKRNSPQRSFEWICLNSKCSPNHAEMTYNTASENQLISPNRYRLIEKDVNENVANMNTVRKRSQSPKTRCTKAKNKPHENENSLLLNELTKILPEEYVGKDLCRSCFKEVKQSQQAICCDTCDQWTHRSCSDMSTNTYSRCRKLSLFQWICNACRSDEEVVTDKVNLTTLKPSELPEEASALKSSKKELVIIQLNCRSIMNKTEELDHIAHETDADIIVLTETWMDSSVPQQACIPEGYSIIRKDRTTNFKQKYGRNRGGGVAILYKQHIKVERKKYLTDDTEDILWVHIKIKESFMLGVIYRPEYTEIIKETEGESNLEENIRKATEISNNLVITGDFNIDMSDKESKETQTLTNIYHSYGLQQFIKKPTRIDKRNNKPTIIDHIWASKDQNIIKQAGTFHGISDHIGIYMKLNKIRPSVEKKTRKIRDYRKYDPVAFNNSLKENLDMSPVEEYLNHDDVNSATESLIRVLQTTADIHAPLKEVNINSKKKPLPWFTGKLREMIKSKNELLSDFYCHGIQSYKPRISALSNKITQMKRNLKRKFINDKLEETLGDSKKCWKLINYITNRKKNNATMEPEMMNQEKADKCNNFFATIGIKIQKELGLKPSDEINENLENNLGMFKFSEVNETKIGKLIDQIKLDVATGEDNIGAKLIKDSKSTLTPILTKIINKCYEMNTFPESMKNAVIIPIHKKENPDEISNYRPISILPTLSKIFERSAVDQLVEYLEKNNLLSKNQHAYRKQHSTVTCLMEVINHVYNLLENKKYTAIASLDLSKAFDSINHSLLLKKLSKLGLKREAVLYIKSYLLNRKQVTKFQNFTSRKEFVQSGIPQGSIMGPLLFLCFTNDLANEFGDECKMVAYADDTQLIIEAENINMLKNKIEQAITTAQKWYKENSMKNNIAKTEILIFNPSNKNEKMKINIQHEGKKITIETVPYIKILGIFIDNKLNWSKQVNAVRNKAMDAVRNLHRVNHLLPEKHRVTLYKALISPLFNYGDIIWNGCTKKDSEKLQRVQNFAAKSITGNRKYDSATASLQKLKLLNLEQRRHVHQTVFAHKALTEQNTPAMNQLYTSYLSNRNTRRAEQKKLTIPKHKTARFQKSPIYRTITSWNQAPEDLSIGNIKQHKHQLQQHLIKKNTLLTPSTYQFSRPEHKKQPVHLSTTTVTH